MVFEQPVRQSGSVLNTCTGDWSPTDWTVVLPAGYTRDEPLTVRGDLWQITLPAAR